jgi:hypothetical protein
LYIQANGNDFLLTSLSAELQVNLRHELTHSLIHRRWPSVPLWLDEGLAEYFEQDDPSKHPASDRLARMAATGRFPSPERLWQASSSAQLNGEDYELAFAWTRFLLEGNADQREAFFALVDGPSRRGQPPSAPGHQLTDRCRQFWARQSAAGPSRDVGSWRHGGRTAWGKYN